jgi:D-alanine-D-alanine ligase
MTTARRTQVAVFFGGRSVEHEISVITALQLMQAIDPERYDVIPVYIAPNGAWFTGQQLFERAFYRRVPSALSELQEVSLLPKPGVNGLIKIGKGKVDTGESSVLPVDVIIPAFHGQYGEDGCIQGLIEMTDIPYTGSNVVASAVTMNKYVCKVFLKHHDIPVLPALLVRREEAQTDIAERCRWVTSQPGFTSFPLFVKPCNLGSSIGVSRVKDLSELAPALAKVFRYDTQALIEPCVSQIMEINVSVREHDGIHASVVEIPVSQSGVLSYEEKYLRGGGKKTGQSEGMASLTRVIDPQDLDVELRDAAISYARKAFQVLGCSGVARLDFIVDLANGALYFNELNAFPGSCSFYLWVRSQPRVLYTTLIENMIDTAVKTRGTIASLDRDIGLKALAAR